VSQEKIDNLEKKIDDLILFLKNKTITREELDNKLLSLVTKEA